MTNSAMELQAKAQQEIERLKESGRWMFAEKLHGLKYVERVWKYANDYEIQSFQLSIFIKNALYSVECHYHPRNWLLPSKPLATKNI